MKYQITTPSGLVDVEGKPVGKYLAIRSDVGARKKKVYILDHLPTGLKVYQFDKQRTAKLVAQTWDEIYGYNLSETASDKLVERLREIDPDVISWGAVADTYPSLERYKQSLEQSVQAGKEQDRIVRKYKGKWIYFIEGSRYGKEGLILSVGEALSDSFKANIEWAPPLTSISLDARVYFDDIELGRAPEDMPWHRFSTEEIARIDNKIYVVAKLGNKGLLWTANVPQDRGGISQTDPRLFSSVVEAKDFAKEHAYTTPHLDVFTRDEPRPALRNKLKTKLLL